MNYTDNALNILTLKTFKGIGNAWIVKNFHPDTTVESLVELLNTKRKETDQTEYITTQMFQNTKQYIEGKIVALEGSVDGVIAFGDKNFAGHRGEVKPSEQPVVLFYKGDISLLEKTNKNIAVIGLLRPDAEIEAYERRVVRELVERGVTIVSGLALGCDTIAHIQTLESGGKTIAILPSTLESINPASNRQLAYDIVQYGGLLLSEYYEEAKSKREFINRYIQRDRLQALFSDGIVLSASYTPNDQGLDSGSRHAMKYAQGYKLKRAVIYEEEIHQANQMYDLNRYIVEEDEDVISIKESDLHTSIEKLLLTKPIQELLF